MPIPLNRIVSGVHAPGRPLNWLLVQFSIVGSASRYSAK
jgi:hypothetical protein